MAADAEHIFACFASFIQIGGGYAEPDEVVGDITSYPITIRISNVDGTPFTAQFRSHYGQASVFMRFCSLTAQSYESAGPYTSLPGTVMRLGISSGGALSHQSVPGAKSEVALNGKCFTAHAIITNLTGSFSFDHVDVIVGSLSTCIQCISPTSYFPVHPFSSYVAFQIQEPYSLPFSALPDIIVLQDLEPPTLVGCPTDITFNLSTIGSSFSFRWILPTAVDNIGVASTQPSQILTNPGSYYYLYFYANRHVYPILWWALDAAGLKGTCS